MLHLHFCKLSNFSSLQIHTHSIAIFQPLSNIFCALHILSLTIISQRSKRPWKMCALLLFSSMYFHEKNCKKIGRKSLIKIFFFARQMTRAVTWWEEQMWKQNKARALAPANIVQIIYSRQYEWRNFQAAYSCNPIWRCGLRLACRIFISGFKSEKRSFFQPYCRR